MTVNEHKWYFRGDRKILKLNHGDNCTTLTVLKITDVYTYN